MNVLRRLRGIFGLGIVWGLAWGLLGLALGTVMSLPGVLHLPPLSQLVSRLAGTTVGWGIWGVASGVSFGAALMLAEGRRSLSELSTTRVGLWGAIGGLSMPILFTVAGLVSRPGALRIIPGFALAGATLGAASAMSMLWLARRQARREPGAIDDALLTAGAADFEVPGRRSREREAARRRGSS